MYTHTKSFQLINVRSMYATNYINKLIDMYAKQVPHRKKIGETSELTSTTCLGDCNSLSCCYTSELARRSVVPSIVAFIGSMILKVQRSSTTLCLSVTTCTPTYDRRKMNKIYFISKKS